MTIVELVGQWSTTRKESGLYVSDAVALQCAVQAAAMYSGFTALQWLPEGVGLDGVDGDVDLSSGEWAVIRPLALLYVEREQAIALEGAAASGVGMIGRASSEVASDIAQYEADLSAKAYGEDLFSIGPEGF